MPDRDPKPVLYLIDGSSYVFRAYHAIPHLSNRRGEPTNATYGFVNMLLKTLREGQPSHVAVAFDTRVPTFRHERYPEYKANRESPPDDLKAQIPRIHEVVEAMNLPVIMEPGWEADDLLCTLAVRAVAEGYRVVLVTGDKDLMQVIRPGIEMYDGMRDRWIGEAQVREKFGVGPEQVVEAQALIGDSSDNVPGVRGIGEKTAGPLVEKYGTLENLYAHLDEVAGAQRKKLEANREMAFLSRELVTIRTDAPVDVRLADLARREPDTARVRELFTELEFTRLLGDLAPRTTLSRDGYHAVHTEAELRAMIEHLELARVFAYDTETTALDPMRASLVGISFGVEAGIAWYVPVGHADLAAPRQLDRAVVLEAVRHLLEDPARPKYAQHAKYDYLVMRNHGVEVKGVVGDPLLFDYLLDPGKTGGHGLDNLSRTELGHTPITFEDVAGKGKAQKTFDQVPVADAAPYSCEDADMTFRLAELLEPRVEEAGLMGLYRDLEEPLSTVLAEMERVGVRVDLERLRALSTELAERADALETRIYELAGRRFTIHSTRQLGEILFGELGLPVIKRTKTGPSTDVNVLETLAGQHPLPRAILDYRHLTKLKSTYVDALPLLVHPKTGRIHTSFSQTTAATGRLASSDPNLQNIPVRTDEGRRIREAFVADPGKVLISADYSQIELRILAHLSGDPAFAAAFQEGQDIHARTASELLGVPLDAVGPDQRRIAKAINFGIVYGMSAFRLARDLGIERRDAQAFIDHYFERHAGVARWLEETTARAHEEGMVRTLLGRRRLLPDLASSNKVVRAAAERVAINTPIQGTAADVIKLAMLSVARGLHDRCAGAEMILQVHDELLVEAPRAEASPVAEWVRAQMEGAMDLSVPLRVDVGIGDTWATAH